MNESSTRTGLILAAHGSRTDSATNALVRTLARRIEHAKRFDEVVVAFNHGSPTYAEVLDQITATDLTVVPMMTSSGYFAEVELPRGLAANRRYSEVRIRQTPPVGVHPRMADLVLARLKDLSREHRLDPKHTEVLIVGHGTRNHPGSRGATEQLAANLRATNTFAGFVEAFLEEEPSIAEAYACLECENLIVVPFLIGMGQHASADIPEQLGLTLPELSKLPLRQWIKDRLVLCDAAVGTYPNVADLVLDLAVGSGGAVHGRRGCDTRTIRLGASDGPLARWQANLVSHLLQAKGLAVEVHPFSAASSHTQALSDAVIDEPLAGELETALAAGEIDLIARSLRDLPPSDATELEIAAFLPRGEVTESLVSADNVRLAGLAPGSVVGVTNQRRAAQVRVLRPDLETTIVNGSVEDRIRKVRAGDLDAVVLATASLRRLAVLHEACETFSFDDFLPAAGQGIIAVQVRSGDPLGGTIREALDDSATRQAALAEREFVKTYHQSDQWHAAAYALVNGDLSLRARLVSSDGLKQCEVLVTGTDPHEVAAQAVRRIDDQLATMRE